MMEYYQRPPWWFTALAIITVLPALRLPALIAGAELENEILVWAYPVMTVLSAWLAYRCYATDRRPLAWILLIVSILCSVAIRFV